MTTDATQPKPEPLGPDDGRGGLFGWLTTVRSKLGLQGGQTLRDTLEVALKEGHADTETAFSAEERGMLLRLLRFGASRVEDVMVPRADIIALDESEPLSVLLNEFEEAGVSRIPVFHDTLDDPRGMVHVKDLFGWIVEQARAQASETGATAAAAVNLKSPQPGVAPSALAGSDQWAAQLAASTELHAAPAHSAPAHSASPRATPAPSVAGEASGTADDLASEPPLDFSTLDLSCSIASTKIRRPVLYVPPSMPAMNLLIRMQSTRIHMALVVDEYGGTDGLVTIEDLVEQIVGDIEDEHDEAEDAHINVDAKLGLVASARTPVDELEEHLGIKLLTPDEEEEIDTLGGLTFSLLGRVPARGEIVRHASGVEFEVLDADPRRIKKLRIHPPKSGGDRPPKPGS